MDREVIDPNIVRVVLFMDLEVTNRIPEERTALEKYRI